MNKPVVIFTLLQTGVSANGGIESVSQIIRRLRTFQPVVLTNLSSAQTESLAASGIEIHIVPERASAGFRRNPFAYAATYWHYYRKLRELLRATGARVVHANDPLAFQLSLPAVKATPGVRLALNLRGLIDPRRRQPRRRYGAIFRLADRVLFLSQDMAARFIALAGVAPRRQSVTYSVVDPDRFFPRPIPDEADKPVVLMVGAFSPNKGQLEMIRQLGPRLTGGKGELWLAGDYDPTHDPYSALCGQAARPYGDTVRFLGYRADVPELLGRARVVVVASWHEGLMRGMIEAMAVGRPVVSTDVCSAREMLEDAAGGAGKVVPTGAFAELADAAMLYCSDRALAQRAGALGAALASRLFEPTQVVERYEQAYREMLA